ncbi:MAG: hypothetical protein WC273_08170 [Dehalococcoidia bacterium]
MLREETYAELIWDSGRSVRGLVVVWSDIEERDEFQAWIFSVRHAQPHDYQLPPGLEALAHEAPWRGLFIASGPGRFRGGTQGPVTLMFRGRPCRAMALLGRTSTHPSMTADAADAVPNEGTVEYQLLGLPSGLDPRTV